jgi:NTP pyrophosphatase (non-canonical NTP hydrolase)
LQSSNNLEARKALPMPVDSINGMAQEAFDNSEAHGFHDRDGASNLPPTPEMLMLIVSEAAEAMEEDRKGVLGLTVPYIRYREDGKPDGFGPELADIVIRVGHLAAVKGIDLADMVRQVQTFNRTRPHKHGKLY